MHQILKLPPQFKLREDFTYNAGTGDFLRYDGYFGSLTTGGYWYLLYESKSYMVHRLIWKWWYGYDPEYVDHINGDKEDNRIDNLRNVDNTLNQKNSKKRKDSTTGYTGVSYHNSSKRWRARVTVNGRRIDIGGFFSPEEAYKARKDFIDEFFPNLFTERHGE